MSPFQVSDRLCAVLFLFRRTLGRPELVSFIKLPRRHSPLPSVLSLEEVHALLQALRHRRYQAIAMVMYRLGAARHRGDRARSADVDGSRGILQVRHGKGDKPREAKLSPSLYEWLRQYWARERLPERRHEDGGERDREDRGAGEIRKGAGGRRVGSRPRASLQPHAAT
jgi:integrase/recombinase XerD